MCRYSEAIWACSVVGKLTVRCSVVGKLSFPSPVSSSHVSRMCRHPGIIGRQHLVRLALDGVVDATQIHGMRPRRRSRGTLAETIHSNGRDTVEDLRLIRMSAVAVEERIMAAAAQSRNQGVVMTGTKSARTEVTGRISVASVVGRMAKEAKVAKVAVATGEPVLGRRAKVVARLGTMDVAKVLGKLDVAAVKMRHGEMHVAKVAKLDVAAGKMARLGKMDVAKVVAKLAEAVAKMAGLVTIGEEVKIAKVVKTAQVNHGSPR